MANNDKLWFELGVRDEITKELERIIKTTNDLDKALSIVGKKPIIPGIKDGYDNVTKLKEALTKIGGMLSNLRSAKLKVTDPKDLAELNKMQLALGRMKAKIDRFITEMSKYSRARNTKGLADTFLASIGYDTALSQTSTAIKTYTQGLKDNTQAARESADANKNLIKTYESISAESQKSGRFVTQLYHQLSNFFSLYGMERLVKNIITIGGQFEYQHIALQNILGDANEANRLFTQLKDLAIESPKTFMELTTYVKQLSAYQIPANELYDTTKRLSDLSVGLGVDMNRLILAYGQVRSAAVLRGQELRQFTEAGIPMVQALAEKFTQMNGKLTTTADVFKLISQRAVPFKMVQEVLWDMTNQGGQFYNMQEEMADTLYGKWQKLQDAWQIMLGDFANNSTLLSFGGVLKFVIELVVSLTQHLNTLSPLITSLGIVGVVNKSLRAYQGSRDRSTGDAAIRNMELAKLKEANRLERERVMYGRRLTAYEQQIVNNRNKLISTDYILLAQSGQLNRDRVLALIQEGKIEKRAMARLALERGITKEKLRQMSTTEVAGALGMLGTTKNAGFFGSIMGSVNAFMGGPIGWGAAAIGLAASIGSAMKESEEELNSSIESVRSNASQNANTLTSALDNVGSSSDSVSKKIEYLEDALKSMGTEGQRIIEESRRTDDVGQRWDILYGKAKAYKETLEGISSEEGKVLLKKGLKDSGIESAVKDYNKAKDDETEYLRKIDKQSAYFEKAVATISEKYKELADALAGKKLFEQLRIIASGEYADEMKKIVQQISPNTTSREMVRNPYTNASSYETVSRPSEAQKIWSTFSGYVSETEKKLNKLTTVNIKEFAEAFQTEIKRLGYEADTATGQFAEETKAKIRGTSSAWGESVKEATPEVRYQIEQALLAPFKITIIPTTNKNIKTGLAEQISNWQDKNGYSLWNDQEQESAKTDFLGFSKKNSQRLVDSRKAVSQLKRQVNSAKGAAKDAAQSQLNTLKSTVKGLEASLAAGLWTFDSTLTKGGNKANKIDLDAKELRNYIRVLNDSEKSYQYWRKNVGDSAAALHVNSEFGDELSRIGGIMEKMGKLPKGSVFKFESAEQYKQTLKDLKDYYQNIYDTSRKSRPELLQAIKEVDKVIADIERKDFEKQVSDFTSKLKAELDAMTKAWDVFKKVREATGNIELAQKISGVSYKSGKVLNIADALKENIKKNFAGAGVAEIPFDINLSEEEYRKRIQDSFAASRPVSPTQGKGESDADFKKRYEEYKKQLDVYEAKIAGLTNSYGEWQKLQKAVIDSDVAIFAGLLGAVNDYDTQVQRINDNLRKTIESNQNLVNGGIITQDQADEANSIATTQAEDKKWKLSSEYINLMNNSLALAKNEIEQGIVRAQDMLNEKLEHGLVTAKEYADEMEKIHNLQQGWNSSSIFGKTNTLTSFLTGGESGLRNYLTKTINSYNTRQANGEELSQKDLNRFGQAVDTQQALDKLDNSVGKTKAVFDTLAGTLQPVIDIFNQLGMTGVGQVVGGIQGALGGAASGGMAGMALFGAAGGPWGAAIGAGLSITSSILGGILSAHDDALQDEIDASKQRQKEMERLSKNVERVLEKVLGGLYEFTSSDVTEKERNEVVAEYKRREGLHNMAEEYKQTGSWIGQAIASSMEKDAGSQTARDAFKRAAETQEYYDIQRASMIAQRDELIRQRDAEGDKKDSDDDAINNYNQQIRELEDNLKTFALDMAKALYDIDLKDWASQLTDAVVEAWEKGEDAAEAYRKKVREIVKDLTKNMLAQKVVEAAFKASGLDTMIADLMDKNSGILGPEHFMLLADGVNSVAESTAKTITGVLDAMESKGYIDKGDSSSSGLSSNIKAITEQTADIIASYLNAIRADVSVNRTTLYQILSAVQGHSEMPAIAEAQLQQLQTLVSLARERNAIASEVRAMIHRFETGQSQISIK